MSSEDLNKGYSVSITPNGRFKADSPIDLSEGCADLGIAVKPGQAIMEEDGTLAIMTHARVNGRSRRSYKHAEELAKEFAKRHEQAIWEMPYEVIKNWEIVGVVNYDKEGKELDMDTFVECKVED